MTAMLQGMGGRNEDYLHSLTIQPIITLLGISPQKLKTFIHTKTCTQIFIAAILTTAKTWKQPRFPSVGKWINKLWQGASLVAQWLRICLLMQGTRVRALVWEDPTCRGATRPWATTTEPARLEPVLHNKRGRDSERPAHRDEEWPPLATTRESPRTETKTQHSQK